MCCCASGRILPGGGWIPMRPCHPTLTFLTSVALINVNKVGLYPLGRHLFARGLLPFQHRRHVFLRGLLLNFSTCTCKSSRKGLIYTKKGGPKPPLPLSLMQRYNIFRPKANCVKIAVGTDVPTVCVKSSQKHSYCANNRA